MAEIGEFELRARLRRAGERLYAGAADWRTGCSMLGRMSRADLSGPKGNRAGWMIEDGSHEIDAAASELLRLGKTVNRYASEKAAR
jgi:hypothetical protein